MKSGPVGIIRAQPVTRPVKISHDRGLVRTSEPGGTVDFHPSSTYDGKSPCVGIRNLLMKVPLER